jgi:hypothetical protein
MKFLTCKTQNHNFHRLDNFPRTPKEKAAKETIVVYSTHNSKQGRVPEKMNMLFLTLHTHLYEHTYVYTIFMSIFERLS